MPRRHCSQIEKFIKRLLAFITSFLTRAKKRRKDWLQSAWMYKSSREEFNVIALVTLIIILKHIQPHSQARN